MEEIHATGGSVSSVSVYQERITDSATVPSTGAARESARTSDISRLRSVGDAQTFAEAECLQLPERLEPAQIQNAVKTRRQQMLGLFSFESNS